MIGRRGVVLEDPCGRDRAGRSVERFTRAHCRRAPDGPGALSHFDLARKDCLGTARNTTSKVWFTVANGVLSDVYYPTIDNTNVETLQYIVTDGSTFTDLQTRDMTLHASSRSTARRDGVPGDEHREERQVPIVTDYVTDPSRNTLLMQRRSSSQPATPSKPCYELYVRFDPTVNGNGGGGAGNGGADSATSTPRPATRSRSRSTPITATNAANRDYAQPVFAALDGRSPRSPAASPARPATGWPSSTPRMRSRRPSTRANGGNIVQIAEVDLRPGAARRVLALGFGATQAEAVAAAEGSLSDDVRQGPRQSYENGLGRPTTTSLQAAAERSCRASRPARRAS